MKSKKEVLKQFEEHYRATKHGLKNQWKHIEKARAFYSGDYMSYKDGAQFGRGSSRRVKEVQFNRVKPYVNSIVGFMAQMRRKPDYQAKMESADEQKAYSEYLNNFSDYVRENANADQVETRQDMDLVKCGIGITDTAITLRAGTPTRDPNGEVIIECVDGLHAGWDLKAVGLISWIVAGFIGRRTLMLRKQKCCLMRTRKISRLRMRIVRQGMTSTLMAEYKTR